MRRKYWQKVFTNLITQRKRKRNNKERKTKIKMLVMRKSDKTEGSYKRSPSKSK